MNLKMTPTVIILGGIFILAVIVFTVVYWPWATKVEQPSDIFRFRTTQEDEGRKLYIANGCINCHSQSVRLVDWGLGAERIAQAGDYVTDRPILLGSIRTGPDLIPGRWRAPGRLAHCPFYQPALYATQFHHAALGISGEGKYQKP